MTTPPNDEQRMSEAEIDFLWGILFESADTDEYPPLSLHLRQAARLITQLRTERDAARTDLAAMTARAEKWCKPNISIGTKDLLGFPVQYACEIADTSFSEVAFSVECPDLEDDNDTLRTQLSEAVDALQGMYVAWCGPKRSCVIDEAKRVLEQHTRLTTQSGTGEGVEK